MKTLRKYISCTACSSRKNAYDAYGFDSDAELDGQTEVIAQAVPVVIPAYKAEKVKTGSVDSFHIDEDCYIDIDVDDGDISDWVILHNSDGIDDSRQNPVDTSASNGHQDIVFQEVFVDTKEMTQSLLVLKESLEDSSENYTKGDDLADLLTEQEADFGDSTAGVQETISLDVSGGILEEVHFLTDQTTDVTHLMVPLAQEDTTADVQGSADNLVDHKRRVTFIEDEDSDDEDIPIDLYKLAEFIQPPVSAEEDEDSNDEDISYQDSDNNAEYTYLPNLPTYVFTEFIQPPVSAEEDAYSNDEDLTTITSAEPDGDSEDSAEDASLPNLPTDVFNESTEPLISTEEDEESDDENLSDQDSVDNAADANLPNLPTYVFTEFTEYVNLPHLPTDVFNESTEPLISTEEDEESDDEYLSEQDSDNNAEDANLPNLPTYVFSEFTEPPVSAKEYEDSDENARSPIRVSEMVATPSDDGKHINVLEMIATVTDKEATSYEEGTVVGHDANNYNSLSFKASEVIASLAVNEDSDEELFNTIEANEEGLYERVSEVRFASLNIDDGTNAQQETIPSDSSGKVFLKASDDSTSTDLEIITDHFKEEESCLKATEIVSALSVVDDTIASEKEIHPSNEEDSCLKATEIVSALSVVGDTIASEKEIHPSKEEDSCLKATEILSALSVVGDTTASEREIVTQGENDTVIKDSPSKVSEIIAALNNSSDPTASTIGHNYLHDQCSTFCGESCKSGTKGRARNITKLWE